MRMPMKPAARRPVAALSVVLGSWRDGIATVVAQPVILLAGLPSFVSWSRPSGAGGGLLNLVVVQFVTAATGLFVYRYRSLGAAPPPGDIAALAARRVGVLVAFALATGQLAYLALGPIIAGFGTGDVPGGKPALAPAFLIGLVGFYVTIRLLLFPQAVVAEGGLWGPLRRAWSLSGGRFWLLAMTVWLPRFLVPGLILWCPYARHPVVANVAGSVARPVELAVLTVLYMRLAANADAA